MVFAERKFTYFWSEFLDFRINLIIKFELKKLFFYLFIKHVNLYKKYIFNYKIIKIIKKKFY